LGIPFVGRKVAQVLAEDMHSCGKVKNLTTLREYMMNENHLLEVYGVGKQTVEALLHYFSNEAFFQQLQQMEEV